MAATRREDLQQPCCSERIISLPRFRSVRLWPCIVGRAETPQKGTGGQATLQDGGANISTSSFRHYAEPRSTSRHVQLRAYRLAAAPTRTRAPAPSAHPNLSAELRRLLAGSREPCSSRFQPPAGTFLRAPARQSAPPTCQRGVSTSHRQLSLNKLGTG